jgi:uncharacterized protein YacL
MRAVKVITGTLGLIIGIYILLEMLGENNYSSILAYLTPIVMIIVGIGTFYHRRKSSVSITENVIKITKGKAGEIQIIRNQVKTITKGINSIRLRYDSKEETLFYRDFDADSVKALKSLA